MAIFGYRDSTGFEHESYDAACRYYGADTIASMDAEAAAIDDEEWTAGQDAMEARGGPQVGAYGPREDFDDIPF